VKGPSKSQEECHFDEELVEVTKYTIRKRVLHLPSLGYDECMCVHGEFMT
jgi:hypothetical protein